MVAAFLMPLCLLVPAVLLTRELRRQRRLLEEGRGAQARVTVVKGHSTDKGRQYRVTYEFATREGSQRTGRYTALRQAPDVGAEIVVLYHPDEEKWSARYPLSLVRVVSNA